MSKNREPVKPVETESESIEEEEESDDSSEEEETGAGDTKKPLPPPLLKSQPPVQASSTDEEEYETESESDNDLHTESKPVIVNDPPKSSAGVKKSQAINTKKSIEEEEESDDSSEEEETGAGDTKKPLPPPLIISQPPLQAASTDEEEYETDSESDHGLYTESKPVIANDPPKSSAGVKKSQAINTATTESVIPAKRPSREKKLEAKRPKKTKPELVSVKKETVAKDPNKKSDSVSELNSGASADIPKKGLFQRLWSEDDEIVILEGMIEYEAKKNSNPITDIDAFLGYIKKDLHVDVHKEQLLRKIRKLKIKYADSKSKARTFTKPHELAIYELSEKIWGNEKRKEIATPNTKANGKTPSKKSDAIENGASGGLMSLVLAKGISSYGLTTPEKILRIGAELFESEEEIEGSNEWKKLVIEDMELTLKKLDVMRARTRLVLD